MVRLARPGGIIVLRVYNAFLSGPGASLLGCLDTDSSRVIRCCATERASTRGARHGVRDQYQHPESTVTPWLRSKVGLPKMASNTCARIERNAVSGLGGVVHSCRRQLVPCGLAGTAVACR